MGQRLLELGAVVIVEWGTWSRNERDALRERARELGATAELRFLDAEPGELWRRISARDRERTQASRPISSEDSEGWAAQIERRRPMSSRSSTRRRAPSRILGPRAVGETVGAREP